MGPFMRVTNAPFGLYVPIYSTLEQVMIKSCYIEVDNHRGLGLSAYVNCGTRLLEGY
jgi:hypothetical protein